MPIVNFALLLITILANRVHINAIEVNKRPPIRPNSYMLTFEYCRLRTTPLPSGSRTPNALSPIFEPSLNQNWHHHQTTRCSGVLWKEHYTNTQFAKYDWTAVRCNTVQQNTVQILHCTAYWPPHICAAGPSRHCTPFLHPRVQNVGNIQNVL